MKKRKNLRRLKKMRRAGVKAWKKKKRGKWQIFCTVWLISVLCISSYKEPVSWQEIDLGERKLIQEQYELEKSGKTESAGTKKPVLKEGAALFLKEGKLLFFRVREEETQQKQTD